MLREHANPSRKILPCHLDSRHIYLDTMLDPFSASWKHLFTVILHCFTGAKVSSQAAPIVLHI